MIAASLALGLAACAAPNVEVRNEAPPWWRDTSRGGSDGCRVPYIAGDFFRTYVPSGSRYVNDHALVRGHDGTWHLYGITSASEGIPETEHEFLHATAPTLFGPWSEQADILVADPASNEQVLWAPSVIEREPGRFTLFYYADLLTPEEPMRGTRRAESSDLWHWQRVAASASPAGRAPGGRDPFVLAQGKHFFLYSVGVDARSRGQILLSESDDPALGSWSPAVPVLTDPVPALPWRRGNVQSPFVVTYDGRFYLFVTRKSQSPIDYVRTNVFCSLDPRHFEWRPIADLRAHAAEVVVESGRHFITSAGWTKAIGETNRGLSIAPLEWATPNSAGDQKSASTPMLRAASK